MEADLLAKPTPTHTMNLDFRQTVRSARRQCGFVALPPSRQLAGRSAAERDILGFQDVLDGIVEPGGWQPARGDR